MPEQLPEELSIVIEKGEPLPTVPVSGAFGSPSPDGTLLIANLFIEYASVPNHVQIPRSEKGEGFDMSQERRTARGDFTRQIVSRIALSPEAAVSLGNWMVQRGTELLARRKKS